MAFFLGSSVTLQNKYFIKICKYNYLSKKLCIIFHSKATINASIMHYKYMPLKKQMKYI